MPNDSNLSGPRILRFVWLAMVICIVWIAWPGRFYFLNDDMVHIPLAANGVLGHNNSIRYLGDLSLITDYWLYGKWAIGYHITNLLLHLINIGLFAEIIRFVFKQTHPSLPVFATLLFAFYGFHSDAVFWIIGRSATLSFLFLSIALLIVLKAYHGKLIPVIALITWILALFSYESVWFFPFWMIFFFRSQRHSDTRHEPRNVRLLVIVWFIFLAFLAIRKMTTGAWLGTYEGGAFESFQWMTLATNYFRLAVRTFLPPLSNTLVFIVLGLSAIVLYLLMAYWLVRKKLTDTKWNNLHIGWILSYLPYLSLGIPTKTIESERYLYLPSAFFAICLIHSLYLLLFKRNKVLFYALCSGLTLLHAGKMMNAAANYAACGKLVQQTYEKLLSVQPIDELTIVGLPATLHGIPTLRTGFESGYFWLCNPGQNTDLIIADTAILDRMPAIRLQSSDRENSYKLTFRKP